MAKRKAEHVGLAHGGRMVCGHCHDSYQMTMPVDLDVMLAAAQAYAKKHADCDPCPAPAITRENWIQSNDVGNSSITLWTVMEERVSPRDFTPAAPRDPSDFGRCYRLLKLFPEWRADLADVAKAHPEWAPLIANWSELERLYEEELPSGRAPKLYARMKALEAEVQR